jgi:hypothetical protein
MTHEEKRKIYAAIAAPFPEEAIERTDGRVTGRGYSTTGLKYQYVANRLNEVLGIGGWRAHRTVTAKPVTTSKGRDAFEAICDITLELGEWVDGTFIVFAESLADGGHTALCEADARKGAYTNAFKKAAAFFGCGKAAYEGTLDDDNVPSELPVEVMQQRTTPPATAPVQQQSPAAPTNPRPITSAPSRNRLTSKQLAAIWAIGRKLGYDQQSLRQHIKTTFGVQPEFLSRDQASQAIGALSKQAGNGHAEQFEREPGIEG